MTARRRPAPDHLDAVVQMAEAHGWQRIYESGPCLDGWLTILADRLGAHDYLHGKGDKGRQLKVYVDRQGQVQRVQMLAEDQVYADTDELAKVNEHTPAHRLYWTLQMIEQQTLDDPAV